MSENQVIPDEAVEAAIKGFNKYAQDHSTPSYGYVFNDCLTAALEAAAPHMLNVAKADAWDECEAAKYMVMLKSDGSGLARIKTNPYRPTP